MLAPAYSLTLFVCHHWQGAWRWQPFEYNCFQNCKSLNMFLLPTFPFLISSSCFHYLLGQLSSYCSGVRRGGGSTPPPRTRKNRCRKMMLFPKALFLATNFPKNRQKFNFSIEFSSKKSQNFPNQLCFSSKRAKI